MGKETISFLSFFWFGHLLREIRVDAQSDTETVLGTPRKGKLCFLLFSGSDSSAAKCAQSETETVLLIMGSLGRGNVVFVLIFSVGLHFFVCAILSRTFKFKIGWSRSCIGPF